MINRVKQFNFKGQTIHIVTADGESYFVAREVAKVLGYPWPANAVRDYVNNEDKITIALQFDFMRGNPARTIINKSGLNSLIANSTSPRAAEFKEWAVQKLTPSIRKHATYVEGALNRLNAAARLAKELKKRTGTALDRRTES